MLTVALWRKSTDNIDGKWLSVICAVVTYKLFEGGAVYSELFFYIPHLLDLVPGEVLLIGPLLFLFSQRLAGGEKINGKKAALHFLPFAAFWIYNASSVFVPAATKVQMWQSVLNHSPGGALPLFFLVLLLSIKLHLAIYLVLSWKNVSLFSSVSEHLRADSSPNQLLGLKITIAAFFLLEVLWVVLFVAQQFFGVGALATVGDIWLLFVAAFVLSIGYVGLQNPSLVFSQEELKIAQLAGDQKQSDNKSNIKYFHSALPESTSEQLATKLEQQLTQQKLYLNENLTLTELAKATGIKAHTLSQVINQTMKTNFYRLINGYRVQHATALIDDKKTNWTIERIALESGFNNRVTFSKAFKEILSCTPSEYKKQNQKVG